MKKSGVLQWVTFYIVICSSAIFAAQVKNIFDCGITGLEDVPFFSEEISENFPKYEIITNRSTFEVEDCSIEENDYVEVKFDETNQDLSFVLKGNLSDFRKLKWNPVLEFVIQLKCKTEPSDEGIDLPVMPLKQFIFLIVIKDENLHVPYFAHNHYTIYVSEKSTMGYSEPLNDIVPITITDLDYNPKNANVTIDCVEVAETGKDCKFVRLEIHPSVQILETTQGNNYDLHIFLVPDKEITQELKFKVIAREFESQTFSETTVRLIKDVAEPEQTDFPVLPVLSGIGVVVLSLIAILGYTAYKRKKVEDVLRDLADVEIQEFKHGSASISTSGKRSVTVDVNAPIMSLPYQRQFDIPRENLRIDETSVLGTGAFGIVMKGSVNFGRESTTVAVKTVKRNVGVLYFKALLSELKIMAYIGKNNNVVSLVGACTHNIRKRELYIALEYCANGNFHSYLKCRKDSFSNWVSDGKLHYAQINPYGRKNSFSKTVSTYDLVRWSYQIASGMEFLRAKSVIHGDLAARNVLLDENRVAKIADFGLSRRIVDYQTNYYHTKTSNSTPLPWKWMAPESLKYMTFSHKSDIWSFGIVLWETFSLAQTPYPGLSWSENFVDRLEKGLRMTKPSFASDNLYLMMQDCWNTDPDDRPVIDDLKRLLEGMMNELLQQQGGGYLRVLGEKQIVSVPRESIDSYYIPQYSQYFAPTEC